MSEKTKKSPEQEEMKAPEQEEMKAPEQEGMKALWIDPGPFPCWRYHRTHEARIFHSSEELQAAGEGWRNTPYPA